MGGFFVDFGAIPRRYDLSPMAVVVSSKGRRWYDFVTSVCAIVGGTFTVLGLVDGMLYKIMKGGKQL